MNEFEKLLKSQKLKLGSLAKDVEENPNDRENFDHELAKLEISGNYEIGDVIASGGLKTIRTVTDNNTRREVAMAQLKKEYHSLINIERFIREARTLASLEHANIVPIYEISHKRETGIYFTMKLLSGETLASIIRKIRKDDKEYIEKYPQKRLLEIFLQACDAISYAHSKNIIHLDIKPENIQISEFGEVYVLDWGMAKSLNEADDDIEDFSDFQSSEHSPSNMTMAGSINGTPGYMSPEQAHGFHNSEAQKVSDIYSLGATLYTIIYQQRPYSGSDTRNIIEYTKTGKQIEFDDLINGKRIPSALQAICKKATMYDSKDRYANVADLKDDVYRYMNDFSTNAEELNFLKFTQLFIKRHYSTLISLSIIAVIFCTIAYFSLKTIKEKEEIAEQQNIKLNATSDEILTGTLEKHKTLRNQYAYGEILANYDKLKAVGYNFPEFWFDEGKLYAGELKYREALSCFKKAKELDPGIARVPSFNKMYGQVKHMIKITRKRPAKHEDIIKYALNLDSDTQNQLLWNLNNDPSKTLKQKLELLFTNLCLYNKFHDPENINYKYEIKGDYVIVDLSNNPHLGQIRPILGLPIDELIMDNASVSLDMFGPFLRKQLSVLRISNYKKPLSSKVIGGKLKKLVARNSVFTAGGMKHGSNLKQLDLEGAKMHTSMISPNDSVEYLNIAFTGFNNLNFLTEQRALKTLVIDQSMTLKDSIRKVLEKRGTEIVVKKLGDRK